MNEDSADPGQIHAKGILALGIHPHIHRLYLRGLPLYEVRELAHEVVYRGRVFEVWRETYRGHVVEKVVYRGAVVIVPVEGDRLLLIRQYRPVVGEYLYEFPAGTLEPGESPEECALRELEEETGYRASILEKLGSFYSSPGYSTEVLHAYLATGLKRGSARPDEDEEIEGIVTFGVEELLRMVRDGEIKDAKTVTAFTLYLLRKSKDDIQTNNRNSLP